MLTFVDFRPDICFKILAFDAPDGECAGSIVLKSVGTILKFF